MPGSFSRLEIPCSPLKQASEACTIPLSLTCLRPDCMIACVPVSYASFRVYPLHGCDLVDTQRRTGLTFPGKLHLRTCSGGRHVAYAKACQRIGTGHGSGA